MELQYNPLPENKGRYEGSFREFILSHYEKDILQIVRDSASAEDVLLHDALLTDIFVQSTIRERILFGALVRCTMRHNDCDVTQLYIVNAFCDIRYDDGNMQILGIEKTRPDFKPTSRYADNLMPVVPKYQMETFTNELLRRYLPEGFEYLQTVQAELFALRLGLNIRHACLDPEGTVLGRLFFEDGEISTYSPSCRKEKIRKGTLIVNTDVYGNYNGNIANFTIMHECVHWMIHCYSFWLEKKRDPGLSAMICRNREEEHEKERKRTAVELMERQANAIAACILMRRGPICSMIEAAMSPNNRELSFDDKLNLAITRISEACHVSKVAAAIRIRELGYLDPVEGNALLTFEVSRYDVLTELLRNPALEEFIRTGAFVFADNHVCRNEKRFITTDENGTHHMSLLARNHMGECCLKFRQNRTVMISPSGMFRSNLKDVTFDDDKVRFFLESSSRHESICESLPVTFEKTLDYHMKRLNLTNESLAERAQLSRESVRRYRNIPYYHIPLRAAVAICVGMKLEPEFGFDLISKTEYRFRSNPEDRSLYRIVEYCRNMDLTVDVCNKCLTQMGFHPLNANEKN